MYNGLSNSTKRLAFGNRLFQVCIIFLCCIIVTGCGIGRADLTMLNVSYDPTRELYQEYNMAFVDYWKQQTGQQVNVLQSHGGAGSQARAVIDGLSADVVTLALAYDIDMMYEIAELIPVNWQQRLPYNSTPYTSTIVFLVRENNPKNIRDWSDLIRSDVAVITPNPKTSGGARWNYLAAWGYAMKNYGDELMAMDFVTKLYKNVSVLDTGARGSTTTFAERELGDVLIAWENEALLAVKEFGDSKFEIVVPSVSILAEPPVTVIDKNVDQKGTRELAEAYLSYLYSDQAQQIIAKHYFRPRNEQVLQEFRSVFTDVELFTIDEMFGGWLQAQSKHFSDEGLFDQIYQP